MRCDETKRQRSQETTETRFVSELNITPEARGAARKELYADRQRDDYAMSVTDMDGAPTGHFVQLYGNALVAEKDREIDRLLTENEKLRFEVTEIRRVIGDRYPDALMWDALHDYKQQLTELREISEKLATFETADEHMLYSALLEQWKEKNEK